MSRAPSKRHSQVSSRIAWLQNDAVLIMSCPSYSLFRKLCIIALGSGQFYYFFFSSFCLKGAVSRITPLSTVLSPPAASPSAWQRWRAGRGGVGGEERENGGASDVKIRNNLWGRQRWTVRARQKKDETVFSEKGDVITSPKTEGKIREKKETAERSETANHLCSSSDRCLILPRLQIYPTLIIFTV